MVALLVRDPIIRLLAIQGLILLEGWKAAFLAIFLFSLAFSLDFDGVHPELISVLIIARLEISSGTPAPPGRSVTETTPSTTEEDAAEEEEDPGGDGEPDSVTD